MSQKQRIIKALETEGEVSNVKAFNGTYGGNILRLGAIILTLRKEGWKIRTEMEGQNKNQAVYYLVAKPAPKQELLI